MYPLRTFGTANQVWQQLQKDCEDRCDLIGYGFRLRTVEYPLPTNVKTDTAKAVRLLLSLTSEHYRTDYVKEHAFTYIPDARMVQSLPYIVFSALFMHYLWVKNQETHKIGMHSFTVGNLVYEDFTISKAQPLRFMAPKIGTTYKILEAVDTKLDPDSLGTDSLARDMAGVLMRERKELPPDFRFTTDLMRGYPTC